MTCNSCGKPAKNGVPLTPALCAQHGIPHQAGLLCLNCLTDIKLSGQWHGKGWAWLQAQKDKVTT